MTITSLDRAKGLIEELLDQPDDELRKHLPGGLPLPAVRVLMPFLPSILPDDPEEFERQLGACEGFIAYLRGAAEVAPADEPA